MSSLVVLKGFSFLAPLQGECSGLFDFCDRVVFRLLSSTDWYVTK